MSAPKWTKTDDFWAYPLAYELDYFIDQWPDGTFQAQAGNSTNAEIGPRRKTLKAAHNDCKRHAKKLRAALVQFDRAKLP